MPAGVPYWRQQTTGIEILISITTFALFIEVASHTTLKQAFFRANNQMASKLFGETEDWVVFIGFFYRSKIFVPTDSKYVSSLSKKNSNTFT